MASDGRIINAVVSRTNKNLYNAYNDNVNGRIIIAEVNPISKDNIDLYPTPSRNEGINEVLEILN